VKKKTKNVTDKSYQCYQFLALSLDIVSAYLKFLIVQMLRKNCVLK
jgi:hypothetical protein